MRVGDQAGQFEVPDPLIIVIAHPALSIAIKDDHDLSESQVPEVLVLQASGAPLAEQIIDRVYGFGLFFARCPFPGSSAEPCAFAAALG